MTYAEKLRLPAWQKKRLEIFERDNFTCQLCSDTDSELQVHHKEYKRGVDPWEYDNSLLTTLCKDCHGYLYKDCELPYRIIKLKRSEAPTVLFIVDHDGLHISPVDEGISLLSIKHKTLKPVIQAIINYWLIEGMENNLTDPKYKKIQ